MFFNNKFNTFFGLNLTLVYTFPMCMTWRFHFPLRNYDFKSRLKTGTAVAGPLASNELQLAELCLLKCIQRCYIRDKNVANTIVSMSPYRDENAVLRVGGRIVHGGVFFFFFFKYI